jgi:hypothetical protein
VHIQATACSVINLPYFSLLCFGLQERQACSSATRTSSSTTTASVLTCIRPCAASSDSVCLLRILATLRSSSVACAYPTYLPTMRLLYTDEVGKLEWTEDLIGEKIPAYAILSHTWEEGQEVTFHDIRNRDCDRSIDEEIKSGYRKISFCARQAKLDGLHHFWVDTCCIDKTNSVELQEAINSMLRWYQRAEKCYVYLPDVKTDTLARIVSFLEIGKQRSGKVDGSPAVGHFKTSSPQYRSSSSLRKDSG